MRMIFTAVSLGIRSESPNVTSRESPRVKPSHTVVPSMGTCAVRDFCEEGGGSRSGEELILRLARRLFLAVRDATERYVDDRVVLVAELEHGD